MTPKGRIRCGDLKCSKIPLLYNYSYEIIHVLAAPKEAKTRDFAICHHAADDQIISRSFEV